MHKRTYFISNSMKSVFGSDLFKDSIGKLVTHINETEHVKDNTVQDILVKVLNKTDEHRIAIKVVYRTLNHQKNTLIECIEKTADNKVDELLHVRMKHFAAYTPVSGLRSTTVKIMEVGFL